MTTVKEFFKKLYGDMTSHDMDVLKFTANDVIEFAEHFIWNYFVEENIDNKKRSENSKISFFDERFTTIT